MYGVNSTLTSTRPVSGSLTPTAGSAPVITRIRPRSPTWVDINSVLICDEPDGARKSLTRVLAAIRPGIAFSRATGAAELLEAYRQVQPDLVLVGIRRGLFGDPDPAQQLLRVYPTARVIVFGALTDARAMIGDVAHGAAGLLMWEPNEQNATARVNAPTLPPAAMARFGGHRGAKPTERELQILRGMSEGHSNGEIGRELYLSEDTVKTHARRLFQKLGARD
jgi:DNA-binding NarL/FixJ family response regulator